MQQPGQQQFQQLLQQSQAAIYASMTSTHPAFNEGQLTGLLQHPGSSLSQGAGLYHGAPAAHVARGQIAQYPQRQAVQQHAPTANIVSQQSAQVSHKRAVFCKAYIQAAAKLKLPRELLRVLQQGLNLANSGSKHLLPALQETATHLGLARQHAQVMCMLSLLGWYGGTRKGAQQVWAFCLTLLEAAQTIDRSTQAASAAVNFATEPVTQSQPAPAAPMDQQLQPSLQHQASVTLADGPIALHGQTYHTNPCNQASLAAGNHLMHSVPPPGGSSAAVASASMFRTGSFSDPCSLNSSTTAQQGHNPHSDSQALVKVVGMEEALWSVLARTAYHTHSLRSSPLQHSHQQACNTATQPLRRMLQHPCQVPLDKLAEYAAKDTGIEQQYGRLVNYVFSKRRKVQQGETATQLPGAAGSTAQTTGFAARDAGFSATCVQPPQLEAAAVAGGQQLDDRPTKVAKTSHLALLRVLGSRTGSASVRTMLGSTCQRTTSACAATQQQNSCSEGLPATAAHQQPSQATTQLTAVEKPAASAVCVAAGAATSNPTPQQPHATAVAYPDMLASCPAAFDDEAISALEKLNITSDDVQKLGTHISSMQWHEVLEQVSSMCASAGLVAPVIHSVAECISLTEERTEQAGWDMLCSLRKCIPGTGLHSMIAQGLQVWAEASAVKRRSLYSGACVLCQSEGAWVAALNFVCTTCTTATT